MSDLVVTGLATFAMAAVGLLLALRPGREVEASRKRVQEGKALPLEALSHRLLPGLETAPGYRLIGVGIVAAASALFAYACTQLL